MGQQRRHQKMAAMGEYHYAHITGAGTNVQANKAGKGAFFGTLFVNNPGTSVTLTLMDGTTVFAVMTLAANMPPMPFNLALDAGLFYTVSGTCDLTLTFVDYVE